MPAPTASGPDLRAALAPLLVAPDSAALLFDFDGTLSPIVPEPADALPAEGVVDLLAALTDRFRTVAAISGRPVDFLAERLPPSVALSGLYGLERLVDGRRVEHPQAPVWRAQVDRAVTAAVARGPEGLRVEAKGLSVTLHYRGRPDLAGSVRELAEVLAEETGLDARPAKMSVELHPRTDADKGVAVRELAAGATAVLYVGDDLGDLPAFAALAALRREGTATLGVAVATPDLPVAVREVADLLVDGQAGVVELLGALVD